MPYDKFVYNLVTATGSPWDNGAVGYYLRDPGMNLDNTANTIQIFLGTQLRESISLVSNSLLNTSRDT